MSALIGMCGLDCSKCDAYQATQADDPAWKQRVVESWKQNYHIQELDIQGVTCDGCTASSGRWSSHCYECKIRACGLEHGVENCADCPDYICEQLEAFFAFVPDARKTLDALRGA